MTQDLDHTSQYSVLLLYFFRIISIILNRYTTNIRHQERIYEHAAAALTQLYPQSRG